MHEMWVQSLDQEDPPEKEMATPAFLPGKSHRKRSLAGSSPWDCKREGHSLATKQPFSIDADIQTSPPNSLALDLGLTGILSFAFSETHNYVPF